MSLLNLERPARPDHAYIRGMFDSFADRYDLFTRLIGLGQDARLRARALEGVGPGMRVLDVACGTGALAIAAAKKTGPGGLVVGLDFSEGMIGRARRNQAAAGIPGGHLKFLVGPAEGLPFNGGKFDWVVSGFALRNLYEHIGPIAEGIRLSLKPGGRIALLDLTEPESPALRALYHFYLYVMVGIYGLALFGRHYPVAYLPASTGRFFRARPFKKFLKDTGFKDVRAESRMLGAVTLYRAGVL
ncbi:MAG: hypothetical protein A3D28_02330 [Omnitrophica bacterium RIFCSPHIGHO2_02_FULL_63_14]|nr:MAG: hypothetical protein A3D28_02330 [Omnitrophica bacterium RIFCSPHIGHO2_02_FULL_63_14]